MHLTNVLMIKKRMDKIINDKSLAITLIAVFVAQKINADVSPFGVFIVPTCRT